MAAALPSVQGGEPPALVVVISIDQFRHDYLERFAAYFGDDGFKRLQREGADFVDCHYRHSGTKTGPGHAVILTGVHANVGGIIGNEWMERDTFQRVNCVGDSGEKVVGLPEKPAYPRWPGADTAMGRSPRRLLVTTVGDELKLARGGRPRVITVSNKDRAAILMGGHSADAAYWIEQGRAVTSTYYRAELPAWVVAFNGEQRIEKYFGRVWQRALPAAAYEQQGPDDAPGEFDGLGMTRVFPHTITGGTDHLSAAFYDAFNLTPWSADYLTDLALAAQQNEQLGVRGQTDVLAIGYSVLDLVGHSYGPDSHEVMDVVVHLDRVLARLLDTLDERVGLQRCTIVLTADHGAAPMPEHVQATAPHLDAGRLAIARVLTPAEAALTQAYGAPKEGQRWLMNDGNSLLLVPEVLAEHHVSRADAERTAAEAIAALPFIAATYTRTQLERGDAPGELGAGMLLSFNRARSGDVFYQVKPYWVEKVTYGTNHGSPYNYDNHVPLLWFGAGVKPGRYVERVGVDDLAPTLARILGVPAPPRAQGRVLF